MTPLGILIASLVLGSFSPEPHPLPASPNSHLWVVNEIFSNPDGSVQFIELWECCGSTIETSMSGKTLYSDATGNEFTFPTNLTGNTAHRYLLLGTTGFAASPGAPPPDFILQDSFFSIEGDTIRWHIYPNATLTFGPGELPVDGSRSLNRNGMVAINSPTNYSGQSGSLGPSTVPALPVGLLAAMAVLVLLAGVYFLRRS